ncbi:MAG: GNAT family N-acetyltransferase, partial [Candidatus Paceibacterota bacterium]
MSSFYNIRDITIEDDLCLLNEFGFDYVNSTKECIAEFIASLNDNHRVVLIEKKCTDPMIKNTIVAIGTILIEKKIIHSFSNVGHIEDIVVSKQHRGNGIGKILIEYLIDYAKTRKCYKV